MAWAAEIPFLWESRLRSIDELDRPGGTQTTAKGVFEELTIVPGGSGYGAYNLYLDNVWFADLMP